MKESSTAERLRQVMSERNLRQVDVLEMCKPYCKIFDTILDKSHLSQYLKGNFQPKQDKISVLAYALGVSEAWLMGYDVDREPAHPVDIVGDLSPTEQSVVVAMRDLNDEGVGLLTDYVDYLSGKYKKHSIAGMAQDA